MVVLAYSSRPAQALLWSQTHLHSMWKELGPENTDHDGVERREHKSLSSLYANKLSGFEPVRPCAHDEYRMCPSTCSLSNSQLQVSSSTKVALRLDQRDQAPRVLWRELYCIPSHASSCAKEGKAMPRVMNGTSSAPGLRHCTQFPPPRQLTCSRLISRNLCRRVTQPAFLRRLTRLCQFARLTSRHSHPYSPV